MTTEFNQRFDRRRMFQYVNDEPSVMHCHHYATLFSKLAIERKDLDGPKLLSESMEDAFYLVLKKYYIAKEIKEKSGMLKVAEEYFRLTGMGDISFSNVTQEGGKASMNHSHIDEGWIKKWGRTDFVVNYMTHGYLAAAFSLINDELIRSYHIEETASIVKGYSKSEFTITLKK
jgi:hypothetical protein